MSGFRITDPSKDLIEAAEACGLYCFGHPPTQADADKALAQDQERRTEQRRTLKLNYGRAKGL